MSSHTHDPIETLAQRILADGLSASGAALPANTDWPALLQLAQVHAIVPLLHKRLPAQAAPDDVAKTLQRGYLHSAARNTLLYHELAQLLAQLRAANVPVILLKGSALALTAYEDPALRPMTDVDVLIRREDVPRALECAQVLGYADTGAQTRAGDQLEYENEIAVVKPGSATGMVEFHWSLLNSPHHQHKVDMAWFWATAQPLHVGKASALMLGNEAQVLHLCSHLMLHHKGEGLLWWNDIAQVLRAGAQGLHWNVLLDKAREYDLLIPLRHVLMRLHDDWHAHVPPAVLDGLRDARPSAREAQVYAWLTAEHRPVAQRFLADLRGLPNWRARLRFALNNLFPSRVYMRERYNLRSAALLPLAYPYRRLVGAASALSRKSRHQRTP